MKKTTIILSTILSLGLTSCSDDNGSSSASSHTLSSGYTSVLTSINVMSNLTPDASFRSLNQKSTKKLLASSRAISFGVEWNDNSVFVDESNGSGPTTSPKEWMGQQLDKNVARDNGSSISMFGRMKDALGVFCILGKSVSNLDPSTNYPINGTQTISFDAALVATALADCSMDISGIVGESVTLTITDTTDTTHFDKKINIAFPAAMGNGFQDFYVRSNASAVNIGTVENNDNGVSRTLVFLNLSTQVIRLEYVSGPAGTLANNDHIDAYRLYYDEATDEGYMGTLSFTENSGGNDEDLRYILGGKPNATGKQYSLSMIGTNLSNAASYEACVDGATGDIATDGSLCTATAASVVGFSVDTATFLTSLSSNYDGATYNEIHESVGLTFTPVNFVTEAFTTENNN